MLKLIDVFVWICVVLLILTLVLAIAKADEPAEAAGMPVATDTAEVDEYVSWWLQHNPKRRRTALSYTQLVVYWSNHCGDGRPNCRKLDPLLVSIIISLESSWRLDAVGTKTERGLMQVHPGTVRGINLGTAPGQIQAGTSVLRRCFDKCAGKTVRALNCYGTKGGKCTPVLPFAKRRVRIYTRAVKQFRRQL
jgi:hypothetical protein